MIFSTPAILSILPSFFFWLRLDIVRFSWLVEWGLEGPRGGELKRLCADLFELTTVQAARSETDGNRGRQGLVRVALEVAEHEANEAVSHLVERTPGQGIQFRLDASEGRRKISGKCARADLLAL